MEWIRLTIQNKIVQHLTFWLGLFAVYVLSYGGSKTYYTMHIQNTALKFPFYMGVAYIFNYWQVPQLLNKERKLIFALSFLVTSYITFIGFRLMVYLQDGNPIPFLSLSTYFHKTMMFYPPALMMFAYQTQQRQQQDKDRVLLMQQEKLETELKYLKAQLNPHFLFNTLNNLYSYVVNQSPKAADMVLQLSEILDYALYRSQTSVVSITEEIKCIENYIALEKTRYGKRLQVTLEKPAHYIEQKIAPLLLLSMVENAFKHGASGSIAQPEIKISLQQDTNSLSFRVWNTKHTHIGGKLGDAYKEGIGLSNIRRQLNLIYPKNHQLTIDDDNDYFDLCLTITIV